MNAPSSETTTPPESVAFEVYAYDLPKLTEDGKGALPVKPAVVERLQALDVAEAKMRELGGQFERVQLLQVTKAGDKSEPKLVKRIVDGKEERAEDIVRR
jgi:hypothetical protein